MGIRERVSRETMGIGKEKGWGERRRERGGRREIEVKRKRQKGERRRGW